MRRWLPVFVVFLLLLGGIWFWSLGSLPDQAAPTATLTDVEGQVSVKAPNAADFVLAKEGTEVAEGSSIRTGSDGKATVSWYGQAESRLGPDTTIDVLTADDDEESGASLRLRLEAGRVWSRVQRLLDVDADVTVETSDVVATVRGTSFDLEKDTAQPTTLWVADSVVEASGASVGGPTDGFFVPEGSMASFGAGARTTSTSPLSDDDRNTDWFKSNRQADEDFRGNALLRLEQSLGADRGATTGWLHDLTELSESLRERLTPENRREALATRYLLRRLALVRRTVDEGKSGLGYQEFARLDGDFRDRVSASPDAAQALRPAALMAQVLYRDVRPNDPAYRIKQQLEEWMTLVARRPADTLFAHLLNIDSRLDEAAVETDHASFDQAGQMVILARQGLTNADRELRQATGVTAAAQTRLRHLWKALSVRADAMDARLKAAMEPPPAIPTTLIEPGTSTSTPNTAVTSTPSAVVASGTTPVAPTVPAIPVSLQIQPAQTTLAFGEQVVFRAIVVYNTGLTRDVTKLVKFRASPTGYGALNGNGFTASQLMGTVTFAASYTENGQDFSGSAAVNIVDHH
ncbi:MAG TPA: FecR domain-containing protein [Verrucomicrobiae bacterium]|nr:FecR domain-containing protein [Verrucomicrobiae bacterium]